MAELLFPSTRGGIYLSNVCLCMYLLPPHHIWLSLLNHKLLEAKGFQLCPSLDPRRNKEIWHTGGAQSVLGIKNLC